jgi:hypothetical protein
VEAATAEEPAPIAAEPVRLARPSVTGAVGVARLREALAGADRDRLRARAAEIAPLVGRLRDLAQRAG